MLRKKFSDEEIQILPRISSWAITVGSSSEKKAVGFRVKRILDYARIDFMRSCLPELTCGAIQYCDPYTESPESTLIYAYKK